MWFHFWIAFHLCDIVVAVAPVYYTCDDGAGAVAVVAIISAMMQSTLTLKIDKVDVSMVFVVAHSRSRTHIIWYKLEIFGLDFSPKIFSFSSPSRSFAHWRYWSYSLFHSPSRSLSHSPCSSARRLFVTLSSFICILLLITNDYLILMWNM